MTYEQFSGSSNFGTPEWNEYLLTTVDAEHAFRQFNAQLWIDSHRVEKDGKLDIEATAAKVGVPVFYEMPIDYDGRPMFAQGCVEGLKGDKPVTVHLNPEWGEDEHPFIFGHELGHIFIETAAGIVVERRREEVEQFCDFFGRQMALPVEDLAEQNVIGAHEIAALAEKYGIRHTAVIHQLMLAGKVPRKIIIDTGIGEVENPFYSNKLRRHVICLDCELGTQHSLETDQTATSLYDLTSYNWSNVTPFTNCAIAMISDKIDDHVALNKAYGRWSEADEALIPTARERQQRYSNIAQNIGDDEESFEW